MARSMMKDMRSSPPSDSKTAMIKVIFTNLLFVIGVILLVVGFVQATSTAAKLLLFDKYPLYTYEENRCDTMTIGPTKPAQQEGTTPAEPDPQETQRQKAKCLEQLEFDRKVKKTEDLVSSISFLVAGAALTVVFRRFIFEKLG